MSVSNTLWTSLLGIAALTVLLSAATVGTAAHTLREYEQQTEQNNPWWLPIWSAHFDVNGTKSLIASGSISLVMSVIYFIAVAIPRFQVAARPKLSFTIALATALPTVVASIFAIAFVQVLNGRSPDLDTIETWTCRWSETPAIAKELSVPDTFSNQGFSSLCAASRFAFSASVIVLVLQLGLVVVAFLGTRGQAAVVRPTEKRSPDQSSLEFSDRSPTSLH